MKKIILLPIILGSVLLVTGATIFAVALYKQKDNANSFKTNKYENLEAFSNFDVDLTIADFEIKASSDDTRKVVVDETKYDNHTVEVKDNALVIKGKDERKWYERLFAFNWWWQKVKVTVYVPAGDYGEFKFESSTGNVDIPADYTFTNMEAKVSTGNFKNKAKVQENLKISASTGNITLDGVTAKNVELKADTGDLVLNNVAVSEALNTKTSTGSIKLTNVTAKNLTSNSSTGGMTLTNVVLEDHLEIKNSTGGVRIIDSDASTVNIKTSTGSVNATFLTPKIVHATSSTSKPDYPSSTTGGLCEIETGTGGIKVRFKS